jgi:phospholipid N-methyltransferase
MKQQIQEKIDFLKTAFKDREVAAIASSSPFVVQRVLEHIKTPPKLVLEYGAGNGVMTKALLKYMPEDGVLVAIESNEVFCEELQKITDARLRVFHGTVQSFYQETQAREVEADVIVSSIPFSFLSKEERNVVVQQTKQALKKQGTFIIFHQYSPLMKKYMQKHFPKVSINFELRNILPCFILFATNF